MPGPPALILLSGKTEIDVVPARGNGRRRWTLGNVYNPDTTAVTLTVRVVAGTLNFTYRKVDIAADGSWELPQQLVLAPDWRVVMFLAAAPAAGASGQPHVLVNWEDSP